MQGRKRVEAQKKNCLAHKEVERETSQSVYHNENKTYMLQAEIPQFGPINGTEKAELKEKSAKLKCSLSNNHISPIQFIEMFLGEI